MNFSSFPKRILKPAAQYISGWVAVLTFLIYSGLLGTFFAFLVRTVLLFKGFSFQLIMNYDIGSAVAVERIFSGGCESRHNLIATGKSSAGKYQGTSNAC